MDDQLAMRCTHCGADNPSGRRFCTACGTKLSLVCDNCGEVHEAKASFCGSCGASLIGARYAAIWSTESITRVLLRR